jgi:hypothetical protein
MLAKLELMNGYAAGKTTGHLAKDARHIANKTTILPTCQQNNI